MIKPSLGAFINYVSKLSGWVHYVIARDNALEVGNDYFM